MVGERKHYFIKEHMMREDDASGGDIIASIAFVGERVSKEDALY